MSYGDRDDFIPRAVGYSTYSDGTIVPHLEILVYRNGVYRGYVEIHTHRVKDDSVSVGVTTRLETEVKP